ncbi:NotI family restriction endonuclease [Aeromonas sp. R1-1]|uniref:NotI family restriction endonuclease n=1 Tax=Aeromonas sp. R1-1 TaxID=3138455 RepID=UPI0034A45894
MSNIIEFFGLDTKSEQNWLKVIQEQRCPFRGRACFKTRKSDSSIAIGTCSVLYGRDSKPIMICPERLLERGQIFTDCLHLLTNHEPGNELHVVPEVKIPGGNVDFFLVSARNGRVMDFVGIELQTMDTTGTVWPERQRFLREVDLIPSDDAEYSSRPYGINWKMTAKTILVQMHHKIKTFEHINKKLVLVIQDHLLDYMGSEFNFSHLNQPARLGDSLHFHSYRMSRVNDKYKICMDSRLSTDDDGISKCLGLQAEACVELEQILIMLERKIGPMTLFRMF